MKIIRYQDSGGSIHYGGAAKGGVFQRLTGDIFGKYQLTDEPAEIDKLLTPIVPTQIIGIGLNYRRHAEETGSAIPKFPVVFMKGMNTLLHPSDPILLPRTLPSEEVDFEAELVVVMGKSCKNVTRRNAMDYVLGYTCANDVSARDWQLRHGGSQWTRGKSFDTFTPLGPTLALKDEIPNPGQLRISSCIDGQVMQDWNTNDMIFDVPALLEFLSGSSTIPAGTVILTGTPHGVGMGRKPQRWLRHGDTVTIEIEGIGGLTNPVRNE